MLQKAAVLETGVNSTPWMMAVINMDFPANPRLPLTKVDQNMYLVLGFFLSGWHYVWWKRGHEDYCSFIHVHWKEWCTTVSASVHGRKVNSLIHQYQELPFLEGLPGTRWPHGDAACFPSSPAVNTPLSLVRKALACAGREPLPSPGPSPHEWSRPLTVEAFPANTTKLCHGSWRRWGIEVLSE